MFRQMDLTVFAHQFSSIAGAGPVTGAIQAAVIRLGSCSSLDPDRRYLLRCRYRLSVHYMPVSKNDGKSMGLLIEKYIGKTGKKVISSVLLALYTDCYRSLCGYGRWYI